MAAPSIAARLGMRYHSARKYNELLDIILVYKRSLCSRPWYITPQDVWYSYGSRVLHRTCDFLGLPTWTLNICGTGPLERNLKSDVSSANILTVFWWSEKGGRIFTICHGRRAPRLPNTLFYFISFFFFQGQIVFLEICSRARRSILLYHPETGSWEKKWAIPWPTVVKRIVKKQKYVLGSCFTEKYFLTKTERAIDYKYEGNMCHPCLTTRPFWQICKRKRDPVDCLVAYSRHQLAYCITISPVMLETRPPHAKKSKRVGNPPKSP